jgi:hypothetical protein
MPAPCLKRLEPCSSAYALAAGRPSCRAASFFWPCAKAHKDQHSPLIKPGTLTAPPSATFSGMSVHADCGWCDCVGRDKPLPKMRLVDERLDLECGEQLCLHLRQAGWGLASFSFED